MPGRVGLSNAWSSLARVLLSGSETCGSQFWCFPYTIREGIVLHVLTQKSATSFVEHIRYWFLVTTAVLFTTKRLLCLLAMHPLAWNPSLKQTEYDIFLLVLQYLGLPYRVV